METQLRHFSRTLSRIRALRVLSAPGLRYLLRSYGYVYRGSSGNEAQSGSFRSLFGRFVSEVWPHLIALLHDKTDDYIKRHWNR